MIDRRQLALAASLVVAAAALPGGAFAQSSDQPAPAEQGAPDAPADRQIRIEERSQQRDQTTAPEPQRQQEMPSGNAPKSETQETAPEGAPAEASHAPAQPPQPPADAEGAPRQPADAGGAPRQPADAGGAPRQPADAEGAPRRPADAGGAPRQPADAGGAPRRPADAEGAPVPPGPPAHAQRQADCSSHKFIQPAEMVAAMAADLDRQKARARGTRYLTLTHLANICARDVAMEVYRQGAIKLVNSLSRSPDAQRIEAIDQEGTILRINIDDLGWDAADWDFLVAGYPYAVKPDTQLFAVLQNATDTKMPFVRADWFASTASRPPIYNALLKLGHDVHLLARDQGVDIEGDIRRFVVQRGGFQKSGESPNNRVVERHPSRGGYFWRAYDFAGNRARQSVFDFPLGPGGHNGFEPDGGSVIFSLPNGFQGYYQDNARGEMMDRGMTAMVRDSSRRDAALTLGISCMGCHGQGVLPFKDEIRESVLSGRAFGKDVRDAVEALYPPSERMQQTLDDDAHRFDQAMHRAGLDPAANLDGVEPITALSDRYQAFLGTTQAAAELGLSTADFTSAVNDGHRQVRSLATRLDQGSVSREEFEGRFAELVDALTDQSVISLDQPKPMMAPQPPAHEQYRRREVQPPVYHEPPRRRAPNYNYNNYNNNYR